MAFLPAIYRDVDRVPSTARRSMHLRDRLTNQTTTQVREAKLVMVAPVIPEVARRATAKGVERGDSLTDLEFLGLPLRVVNMLEESPCHVTILEQFVSFSKDELSGIKQIGEHSLHQILVCLSRYHELDQTKRMRETLLHRDADAAQEKMETT